MRAYRLPRFLFIFSGFALLGLSSATASFDEDAAREYLDFWMESESIVGAQVVIGDIEGILWIQNFGQLDEADATAVDERTKFCVGSCSKPVISALAMALVQDEGLDLDQEIDSWLPEFRNMKTVAGEASRAPTLRELLCHRGGIYSQKKGMNRRQARWIRNFKQSLEESVTGIAKELLIAKPGEEFAYSGAGYCIIGRVLEVAYGKPIDDLLKKRLGQPLGFEDTSYFPHDSTPNISAGSINGKPNRSTPHFAKPFHFPLIGGSLYMTAVDTSKFLRMILRRGETEERRLLREDSFAAYMAPQVPRQPYGLGWIMNRKDGELISVSHSGALASSRAIFLVNFKTGRYGALLFTLGEPKKANLAFKAANQFLDRTVNNL